MAAFLTPAFRDTERERFLADALHGLRQPQKTLPCKYFYDAEGSKLFDQICTLPSTTRRAPSSASCARTPPTWRGASVPSWPSSSTAAVAA